MNIDRSKPFPPATEADKERAGHIVDACSLESFTREEAVELALQCITLGRLLQERGEL